MGQAKAPLSAPGLSKNTILVSIDNQRIQALLQASQVPCPRVEGVGNTSRYHQQLS
jgi:hypothetical protein